MQDHFYFRNHLCITFELLGINLYEWIKAGQFKGVHTGVIKLFAVQIVECMVLLAQNQIVHCDLKPEVLLLMNSAFIVMYLYSIILQNVLFKDPTFLQPRKCDLISHSADSYYSRANSVIPADFDPKSEIYNLKVIDFGSSCFESERIYTYVQSRFYRSPEVILGT